jgi:hypothetical protein
MVLSEVKTDDRALRGMPEPIRCARARTFFVPGLRLGEQRVRWSAANHADTADRYAWSPARWTPTAAT